VAAALAAGCAGGGAPPGIPSPGDEAAVRKVFAEFQLALSARDGDKLLALLDDDSRAEAERAAKAVREAYEAAGAEGKAEQQKALGLTGPELAALTGAGFLKTRRFHGKYDEIPEAKVEKLTILGDKATIHYVEPDGDHEKLTAVRQRGAWKLSLQMPKGG
jgi:hypothetical protein